MKRIPLDEDFSLIEYPDGSTSLRYKGRRHIFLSKEEIIEGWALALRKGVIKRPGLVHVKNVTPFGRALRNLLQ